MQAHTFQIVSPSPWPLLSSLALGGFTTGLVGWFHGYIFGDVLAILGFVALNYIAAVWWRDVIRESVYQGSHTIAVQSGLKYGMILFIASEVMVFFGFFWAFGHNALVPSIEIAGVWPPLGIPVLDPFAVPFLNTLILLSSGASVTWAHYAILAGDKQQGINSLLVTVLLLVVFTGFQAYEYVEAEFTISDSVYGSTFYMLTGLHGLHVFIGTVFLTVCLVRQIKGEFRPDHHLGFEMAALYAHFLDLAWLVIFVLVYWWGCP